MCSRRSGPAISENPNCSPHEAQPAAGTGRPVTSAIAIMLLEKQLADVRRLIRMGRLSASSAEAPPALHDADIHRDSGAVAKRAAYG